MAVQYGVLEQLEIEEAPDLDQAGQNEGGAETPSAIRWRLFVSHFLSTWNARGFEFGAVLFLASIFPGTLLPMSIYALTRGISAILFSPTVGRYIDTAERLHVVRLSIVLQRVAVAASCVIFWFLAVGWPMSRLLKSLSLAVLAFLACIEKLCAIMNMVAVERDWVVVIAGGDEAALQDLNAQMRRIDLFCKLIAPLTIAIIDGASTRAAILFTLGLNIVSVWVEYFAIARVYLMVPNLRKTPVVDHHDQDILPKDSTPCTILSGWKITRTISLFSSDLVFYFRSPIFLPSFSTSMLYFTVLSFSGQMVTYLLDAGFTSTWIGIARTISVVSEISATWAAPAAMARLGPVRSGLWLINSQVLALALAVGLFWGIDRPVMATAGLVIGVIFSRIGLIGFDLCTQVIIQEEVDKDHRGTFSTVESSFQNLFEICSFISTIIFQRPDQFRWPVLISVAAVFTACAFYASFVRIRRGHLVHLSKCMDPKGRKPRSWELSYVRLAHEPE